MDIRAGSSPLRLSFLELFEVAVNRLEIVAEVWDQTSEHW